MSEESMIQTVCPACQSLFEVPEDMLGQEVECTECKAPFTICRYGDTPAEDEGEESSSNTVRMSRTSIGMMPALTDEVTGLGLIQQRVSNSSTRNNLKLTGHFPKVSISQTPPPSPKSWWKFWK